MVGVDRELLEVGAVADGVDAAQPDGRVAGHEDDQGCRELLDGSGARQRADAERIEHGVSGRLQGREERQLLRPDGPDGPDVVHSWTVACGPVRAVVCNELGPPSLLRVEERPDPVPGPGHVVVDVEAAGVNYVDALFVGGQYQIKPPVPFVPGTEAAGRVSQVGESVNGLEAGQRVLVSAGLGGFATKVAAPAAAVTALPDVLDAPRAATFTQSYSTCLFALRERAAAQPGESVLVLGAGGGVGLAAIGVAQALGCRVLGVASTEQKRAAALAAGAESVLDPAAEPVKDSGAGLGRGHRCRPRRRPCGRRPGRAVAARPG